MSIPEVTCPKEDRGTALDTYTRLQKAITVFVHSSHSSWELVIDRGHIKFL